MKHLNIRTNEQDESHILFLQTKWGLDRSEATRRALSLAVACEKNKKKFSREELLKDSKLSAAKTMLIPQVQNINHF